MPVPARVLLHLPATCFTLQACPRTRGTDRGFHSSQHRANHTTAPCELCAVSWRSIVGTQGMRITASYSLMQSKYKSVLDDVAIVDATTRRDAREHARTRAYVPASPSCDLN